MKAAGTAARAHRGAGRRAGAALVFAAAVPLCLCAAVPSAVRAQQVGVAPEHSPFADILTHESITFFAGRFAGNANDAGTGARPGLMAGARLQVRLSSALDAWVTVGEVWTSRLRIDAGGDTAKVLGNLNVKLLAADIDLALNLTGDKTWHGLAPYVALGAGIAWPSTKVVDPGGYELGTDFTLVPTLGTRYFLSRNLSLRFEARDYYYRYSFPLFYFDRPYTPHTNGDPVLPANGPDRVWYNNVTFWVGVSYGFNF